MVYVYSRSVPIVLSSGKSIPVDAVENDLADIYENGCHLKSREWIYGDCSFGQAKASKTVVLFGDSHAAHYFPALEVAAKKSGWMFLSRTKSGCPSIATAMWNERYLREYYECNKWRDAVLAELERIRPQLVILANSVQNPPLDRSGVGPAKPALWHDIYLAGEKEMAEKLLAVSGRIIYMRDMRRPPEPPARCLLRNPKHESSCNWTIDTLRAEELYPLNERVGSPPRAAILDLTDIVCPGGRCPAVHDGVVLMYDNQHFTASYARQLSPQFEKLLE
jgi:hypothetical protein